MKSDYPSIHMKVNKDLYLEFLSDEKVAWTTKKCDNHNGIIKAGRFLSFKYYWYAILNAVTEEDKKNAMIIVMNELDSRVNAKYPIDQAEFHPYELNELIKEGAIEIV